ncbi:pheromone A receptor-domain-containing protein [Mycena olivaceomarginata]|nr:pheromone A receptor-domain-containing protein [Mycena olivaceomarginata]
MSKADKPRAVLVDLAIGLGIPLIQMPLRAIRGARLILEDVGCYPTTYKVTLAYPLIYVWPNVINLISCCHVIPTLRAFLCRRAQFAQFLSGNSGLTPRRYFRLMALASLELLLNFPIATYGLYLTASSEPIAPWISWANTHADFSRVERVQQRAVGLRGSFWVTRKSIETDKPCAEVPRQTWAHLRLGRPCRGLPSIASHSGAALFSPSHTVVRSAIGSIIFLWENMNKLTWEWWTIPRCVHN